MGSFFQKNLRIHKFGAQLFLKEGASVHSNKSLIDLLIAHITVSMAAEIRL